MRSVGTRVRLAATGGLLLALLAGLAAVGGPARASTVASACPTGTVPRGGFTDVSTGDTHQVSIDCLVWWRITGGVRPGSYGPEVPLTRAQLATMLSRLLTRTGDHPGAVPAAPFPDVDRNGSHTVGIDALHHLGVIQGKDGRFHPEATVTRDQMASMLVRLLTDDSLYDLALTDEASFSDIAGNTHAANIRRLAGAGITSGVGGGRYHPSGTVLRGQMASFVMRSADLVVVDGQATLPATRGTTGDHAFLLVGGDKVSRFDPCAPIPYVINASQAKHTSIADTHEAIRRIRAATGIVFSYEGETTEIPTSDYGGYDPATGWPPVIIAWADAGQTDVFDGAYASVVGVGGFRSVSYDRGATWTSVTGSVVLRASADRDLPSGFGPYSSGQLLMHELGHVMGLAHAGSTQVMHATMTANPGLWGRGDAEGLARLGRNGACTTTSAASTLRATAAPGDMLTAAPKPEIDLGPPGDAHLHEGHDH